MAKEETLIWVKSSIFFLFSNQSNEFLCEKMMVENRKKRIEIFLFLFLCRMMGPNQYPFWKPKKEEQLSPPRLKNVSWDSGGPS